MKVAVAALMIAVLCVPTVAAAASSQNNNDNENNSPKFNNAGNLLVTDQFNNRVIEVNPDNKAIVWSFGSNNPGLCNPGPGAIIGTNDAERLADGRTVMAGTGIPPGASPAMPAGCVDNRVIVVSQSGQILWQYGQAGVTGSGPNELNTPVFVIQL